MRLRVERESCIAAAWGLAEATLFFIVPDFFLSWVALEKPRRAFVACGFALAGALVGGTVMYAWGGLDPGSARTALDALPGIRPDMIAGVRHELAEEGPLALFTGPLRGVPYKIYATEWGARGGGLPVFLLLSVPARVLRFLLAVAIASAVRWRLLGGRSLPVCRSIHLGLWVAFYAWYFHVMRS